LVQLLLSNYDIEWWLNFLSYLFSVRRVYVPYNNIKVIVGG